MPPDAPISPLPLTASHADTAAPARATHRLSSRVRLTAHELHRFQGSTLFDHIARVVVLPCCQAEGKGDLGGVGGWMDGALAIDVTRAARLRAHGYSVYTQTIPAEITVKNRLLLGAPPSVLTDPIT